MQFIKKWRHGADACRITWNHPTTRMKITIYPMLHIGLPSFYEKVSREIERCAYVLVEGVTWRKDGRKHPLYDLAARNLGLAAQEDALRYPAGATIINLDMGGAEFRRRLFRLPLHDILLVIFLRPLLWLLTVFPAIRDEFLVYGLLGPGHRYKPLGDTPLSSLLLGERDKQITSNLEAFHEKHGQTQETKYTAIVFGAEHMRAICQSLRHFGFRPGTREWIPMLRVPSP